MRDSVLGESSELTASAKVIFDKGIVYFRNSTLFLFVPDFCYFIRKQILYTLTQFSFILIEIFG